MSDPLSLPTMPDNAGFAAEWQVFRDAWLTYLSRPYGLLSPVGLHWLDERPQTFDGLPGAWRTAGQHRIAVRAGAEEGLLVDGELLDGEVVLIGIGRSAAPLIKHGEVVISPLCFPAQTGQPERYAVQPRDPRAAAGRIAAGIPTYPPDPRWVLPARFEPYARCRPVTLHSIVDQMVKDLAVFGAVTFELDGAQHTLEVYAGPRHELHIPFRDRTSGVTSFAAARLVFAPRPESARGGAFDFVLDFNRAINGPCGLTPHTTCALPPPGNTLPVAVEAGEKIPGWMEQPSDWARG